MLRQGVQAAEGLALHGDAQHGNGRLCGDHARQVGRAARAGDDDLQAAFLGLSRELGHQGGRPVGGDDAALVRDAEPGQHLVGVAHGLPVALAAHNDGDAGGRI